MVVMTVLALAVGMISSIRLINIPVNTDMLCGLNDLFLHKHQSRVHANERPIPLVPMNCLHNLFSSFFVLQRKIIIVLCSQDFRVEIMFWFNTVRIFTEPFGLSFCRFGID
jgi:hypothetical protein